MTWRFLALLASIAEVHQYTGDVRRGVNVGGKLPGFGCLAWSPERDLVACVLGWRTENVLHMASRVTLTLVPLHGAARPEEALVLLEVPDTGSAGRGPDDLAPETAARLGETLRDFIRLDRDGHRIATKRVRRTIVPGPPIAIAGDVVTVRSDRQDGNDHIVLTIQLRGERRRELSEKSYYMLEHYDVRAFAIDDMVLVEEASANHQENGVGFEAAFLYLCSTAECKDPTD